MKVYILSRQDVIWILFAKLTQAHFEVHMQLVSWITLAYVAAWCVGAVMVTASVVNSTLVNVCKSGR